MERPMGLKGNTLFAGTQGLSATHVGRP
jgi:hypothetical protein